MLGTYQLLFAFFFTNIPDDASGAMETIVNMGLREIPVSVAAGLHSAISCRRRWAAGFPTVAGLASCGA